MSKPKVKRFYYKGLEVITYEYRYLFRKNRITYEDVNAGIISHGGSLEQFYRLVYGRASTWRRNEIDLLKLNMRKPIQQTIGGRK